MTTWEYWHRQAKDESLSTSERLLAWEQAYNHLVNALAASDSLRSVVLAWREADAQLERLAGNQRVIDKPEEVTEYRRLKIEDLKARSALRLACDRYVEAQEK